MSLMIFICLTLGYHAPMETTPFPTPPSPTLWSVEQSFSYIYLSKSAVFSFTCYRFTLKQRGRDDNGEPQIMEVTVYDYFVNHRRIELRYSADLPCINVGKPKRPTFFPIEVKHYFVV